MYHTISYAIGPSLIEVRFTQSARRHRIGKSHVLYVIENYEPILVIDDIETRAYWRAPDDRDLVLEIVAIMESDRIIVFHVMPANFRGRKSRWPE